MEYGKVIQNKLLMSEKPLSGKQFGGTPVQRRSGLTHSPLINALKDTANVFPSSRRGIETEQPQASRITASSSTPATHTPLSERSVEANTNIVSTILSNGEISGVFDKIIAAMSNLNFSAEDYKTVIQQAGIAFSYKYTEKGSAKQESFSVPNLTAALGKRIEALPGTQQKEIQANIGKHKSFLSAAAEAQGSEFAIQNFPDFFESFLNGIEGATLRHPSKGQSKQ